MGDNIYYSVAGEFRCQYLAAGVASPAALNGSGTGGVDDGVVHDSHAAADATDVFHGRLNDGAAKLDRIEALFPETGVPGILKRRSMGNGSISWRPSR